MPVITAIDTWTCRVPLDVPIRFRWNTITHRDYTVVRLTTDEGIEGSALAISRGLPTDIAIVDMLAPAVLGMDALAVGDLAGRARQATAASDQFGILANARSLLDVALWDIRGLMLGAPVWQLLGGARSRAGVLLVEGYELPGEDDERFARRLADRAAEGYPALKLEAAGYDDPDVLRRRLELIREYAGEEVQLVVDVNGAWRTVREAAETIRRFAAVDIAWVEDPFPQHRLHEVGALREQVGVPLGAGDDLTAPRDVMRLAEEDLVDVVRIDALTFGGISAASDVIATARQYEKPISTHAYPGVHQHFSFAWQDTTWVEAFPDDLPFEPSHKLMRESLYARIEDGHLDAPTAPGLDTALDLAAVERYARRHHRVTLEDLRS